MKLLNSQIISKKKEEAFQNSDKALEDLFDKNAKLESEIERLNLLLEECDFKIRVFRKENDQLKDDLFNIDSNLAMARKDLTKA